MFFIYGEHGQEGAETKPNQAFYAAAGEPKQIWQVPNGQHVAGITTEPEEYERRDRVPRRRSPTKGTPMIRVLRLTFLVATPLVLAVILWFHPPGGETVYEGIRDDVGEWLFVHTAFLFFIPLIAAVVYLCCRALRAGPRRSAASRSSSSSSSTRRTRSPSGSCRGS